MGFRWAIVVLLLAAAGIAGATIAFLALLQGSEHVRARAGDVDLAVARSEFVAFGAGAEDQLGRVAVGDLNGDGLPDLLVAAPGADGLDGRRPDAGAAYVFLGPNDRATSVDLAAGGYDTVVVGADPVDRLGREVAIADVNGDGLDDLLLSARGDGPGNAREDAGEVVVFFGKPSYPRHIDLKEQRADLLLIGADTKDDLGKSLIARDLNDDGKADLLLGADNADGPDDARPDGGAAYVVFGSSTLPRAIDLGRQRPDILIWGAERDDELGSAIAVGDVNGDGQTDLVVSSEEAGGPDNLRDEAGEVYVIYGPQTPNTTVDIAGSRPDVTVYGADSDDNAGSALAVGDVTGDGVDDLVIGAPKADGPNNARSRAGEAYVIPGSPTLGATVDLAVPGQAIVVIGGEAGDGLGDSLSAGFDLDGDAIGDFILDADSASGPGNGRFKGGEVCVVFGSSALPSVIDVAKHEQSFTIIAARAQHNLGSFLAAGDANGDGETDILLGAQGGDGPSGGATRQGRSTSCAAGTPTATACWMWQTTVRTRRMQSRRTAMGTAVETPATHR